MSTDRPAVPAASHLTGVLLGVAAAAVLTLAAALGPVGPAAAVSGVPQLSVAIDNGRTSARVGDTLSYVITVRNLGTAAATGLAVSQSLPTGLVLDSAEPSATSRTGGIGWSLDLPAGAEATFRSTATVTDTPADLLRLASVACVAATADGPPIVCATHSDQLPAGAVAEAELAVGDPPPAGFPRRWQLATGAGLLAAVAGVVVLARRRGSRPPAHRS